MRLRSITSRLGTRARVLLLALALCLSLGAPRARAQDAAAPQTAALDDLLASLQRVPERANFIVGIPDGATVLQAMQAEGDNLSVLADALEKTSGAWKALAEALGWQRDEMTVAILGGTVVLTGHTQGVQAELGEWTLRCTITPATADHLTRRLELLPRQIVHGQPVFAIENGRYLLALRRPAVQQRQTLNQQIARRGVPPEHRTVQLFVAPADEPSQSLLAQSLRAAGQGDPIPASPRSDPAPAIASLRTLAGGAPQALLLVRDAPGEGDNTPPDFAGWGTHRVVAYTGDGVSGAFSILVRDHRLHALHARLAAFDARTLDPWWDGAAVALMLCETPGVPTAVEPWLMAVLDAMPVGQSDSASARITVWSARPRANGPGLAIHAALQSRADADSARALDSAVESVMGTVEPMSGARAGSWDAVRGLCEVAPQAMREVGVSLPAKGYGAQMLGAESALRWGVQPAPEASRLGRGWDGWMVASLAPNDAPALPVPEPVATDQGAGADADGGARRWISRAIIRLPLLVRAMPTVMPVVLKQSAIASSMGRDDVAALSASMEMMDEVTFESWLDDERPGVALATLRIRLDPARVEQVRARRAQDSK